MKNRPSTKVIFTIIYIFIFPMIFTNQQALCSDNNSVLFISSYHPAFPSFTEQVNGLKSVFDENDISLDIEFMDTKRFPEAKNIENFKTNLKYKLDELPKYRLIITGDDNALQFVLNEQKIFNDTPIVFLGVNNIEKALEQNSNPFITGVIESVSLKETIELISKLQPGITGITAISDMTTSGETDLKSFYKFSTDYNNYYFSDISLKNLSWKEFEKKISEIDGKKTALLLLSAYFDKNNDKKTFEQSINLIKNNAKAPVYHLWRHGIGQGILGGKVICHFNQGKRAAEKAMEIISGKKIEKIPVDEKSPNKYIFDYNLLNKFKININTLPENSIILNAPRNFFAENKKIIFSALAIFLVMSVMLFTAAINIFNRKQTEKKLKESEQKYFSLFKNNYCIMLLIDPESFEIVDANSSAVDFYGWDYDQITHMKITQINTLSTDEIIKEIQNANQAKRNYFHFKHRIKSGEIKDVEVYSAGITVNKKKLLYSIIHDISEKKKIERELEKIERIRSIGTLAGGIAHDFNNLLMILFGNISLAKDLIDKDHPALKFIEDTEKALERSKRLTNQLLTFSKGGTPLKESINIYDTALDVASFDLSGSNVKARFSRNKNLWMAKADKGQIQQLFSNIVINADQAMPDGGYIDFNFENISIEENTYSGLSKGKYIKITITDNGSGIPHDYIDKIFDPYFTTKNTGNGLGLATAFSIVSRHKGKIEVNSKLNEGTIFTVFLPAILNDSDKIQNLAEPSVCDGKKALRILAMDDDEMILNLVKNMLTNLGYSCDLSSDGEDAVKKYLDAYKTDKPYDAVIMDLTVPGKKGGKYALDEIIKKDPNVKALISSGYIDNDVISNYKKYGFKGVVNKPYKKIELENALKKLFSDDFKEEEDLKKSMFI